MTPDELDAIEAEIVEGDESVDDLAALIAALREAWAEQSRLINESSAWLAGADYARVRFSAERDEARAERDEARAERDEWKDNAITLRGLLDNHAHNDEAMNAALLAVTAERDEARAEVERLRDAVLEAVEARAEQAEAAIARVLNLCNEKPECNHGLDCHCDCLAPKDVRAAADVTRPTDGEAS